MIQKWALSISVMAMLFACGEGQPDLGKPSFDVKDPAMLAYVDTTGGIEVLADGFEWTEGPLWIDSSGGYLLFSDIPRNRIMKWSVAGGAQVYLEPSGYSGAEKLKEPGSNGLLLDSLGRLVICMHGDRRVARMDAPLDSPAPKFVSLADKVDGKRFNSPNDAVFHPNGDLYFTDPAYGLAKYVDDPAKETPHQGVYRAKTDGTVELLTDEFDAPNGIAFSNDYTKLYVANSGKDKIWKVFDVGADGKLSNGRIFFDAREEKDPGAPDGLKIHRNGIIYATGPGGVWLFTAEGKALGRIRTGQLCSNVALDSEQKYLYITADPLLVRIRLK
jgi:gluconolactonase